MNTTFTSIRKSRFATAAVALLATLGAATSIGARLAHADDVTPMYDGELAENKCYDTGPGSHEKRTWIAEQDFLITQAETAARNYIKEECAGLYHGRFSQTTTQWWDGHKDGRCEISRDESRGCNALKCFGYSSGTCTTPSGQRLVEHRDAKSNSGASKYGSNGVSGLPVSSSQSAAN